MSKTLVIVESPNKIKTISKILGEDYEVIASYGSIRDLPPNKMGVDVSKNFNPTFVLMKDKVSVLQSILDKSAEADNVILATDNDTEGESIAGHIKQYILPINKNIRRAVFGEITKAGIKKGMDNLRDIDQDLFNAQVCRRIADRLIGFSASPYLMNKYKTNLSAGRTQSACVKLITDLEKQIENFIPQEYWNITAQFSDKNKSNFTAKLESKIKDQEEVEKYLDQIKNEEGFLVSSVISKDKPKFPNPPLITIKLQQIMAKDYNWDPDRVMKGCQSLYECGHITYLRTDSVRISEDAIEPAREFLVKNGFSIPTKPNIYEDKENSQAGHECLRPTNIESTPNSPIFLGDDRIVYKVIFENFLASQLKPAIYATLQIKLLGLKNNKLIFKASGKALKDPGYLKIFGEDKIEDLELPLLQKEELVRLNQKSIKHEQKFTQPPSRYNLATILDDLESKGIGRPSTYANLISTITNRNYVEKQGNNFHPTKLGRDITETLENFFSFVNSNYTAKIEKKLDLIASGKLNSIDMLKEFYGEFKNQLDSAYKSDGADICICGGFLLRRKAKDGNEFFGCTNYPNCKITKSL